MAKDLRLRLGVGELRRLYLGEKMSLEDIARLYGVSRVAVWKYCQSERLARRSRSEARLEAQKIGKVSQQYFAINEDFFSTWSPEMAYVLGLIITDGCIADTGTISLDMNDNDVLEKVKQAMGSQHKISPSKHQKGLFCFHFGRERLVKDLSNLGVLPRKSLNVKFPAIPDTYLRDFIRGVFDGDGSVYYEKRSKDYPLRTSFVSSSEDFINKLEYSLQRLGLPARAIYTQSTKNGVQYKIRYSHDDSGKLFNIMYYDVLHNIYMERKYTKFIEGFDTQSRG